MTHIADYTNITTAPTRSGENPSGSSSASKVTSGIFREISAAYQTHVSRLAESQKEQKDETAGRKDDSSSTSSTTSNNAASASGASSGYVSVTLKPGEMLYLPPFWIHEVCAIAMVMVEVSF